MADEARALPAYAAVVMLHALAHDGFTADPFQLLDQRLRFMDVAEWFLAYAEHLQESIPPGIVS